MTEHSHNHGHHHHHEHDEDGGEDEHEHFSEEERIAAHVKAGKAARTALDYAKANARVGMKLIDLAKIAEDKIRELGVGIAFPANLSTDNEAAHYTPRFNDPRVIGEKDVLKIDIGTHVDGFIADCAVTVDFSGENGKLLEASKTALESALATVKAGINVREIGRVIEGEIRKRGFKPVENLSGHSLDQYVIHAGITVPNYESGNYVFEEGDSFAIEPFASTGLGRIHEDHAFEEIYGVSALGNVRSPGARKLLENIFLEYKSLPFAKRWLKQDAMLGFQIRELKNAGILDYYPLLTEAKGVLISQHETSIIVEKDGCKILV
ncbi:type II methionyl aminopeptidase [Candidatus Micrarchaeota archaeon]|nr:type II methionyl aminopeptidase [Candidatus Micrarchaeota archaeon]